MESSSGQARQDFKVCEDEKHDLECPICLFLVKETMEMPCSHLLCKECAQKLSLSAEETKLPLCCPICKGNFTMSEIHRNTYADRLVRNLNVYCPQREHGCQWKGTISTYGSKHDEVCEYKTKPCHHNGCPFLSLETYLDEHEQNCEFRDVQCEYCNEAVHFFQLNDHHAVCQKYPIHCLNEECKVVIPRNEIKEHVEKECEFTVVSCTLHSFGCPEKFERRKQEDHNQKSTTNHMTLMFHKIKNQDTEIKQLKQRISVLEAKPKATLTKNAVEINVFLLKGADRWIRRKKINFSERNYAVWFRKVFELMDENKLYRYHDVMYVKIKNEPKKSVWWFSKAIGERERVREMETIYEGDDGLVLLNAGPAIYIETETLGEFSYQNESSCFMLHPRQQQKILGMRIGFCIGENNRWGVEYWNLPNDFLVDHFLIFCLLNW